MAATARGRDDPEEVAEARGLVLQGAGRTGPPRVPGSGERGARDGAPGRQLGPPGPMDRSRGGGAAGRIRGAGGACQGRERRRPPAELGQLRRGARGV